MNFEKKILRVPSAFMFELMLDTSSLNTRYDVYDGRQTDMYFYLDTVVALFYGWLECTEI